MKHSLGTMLLAVACVARPVDPIDPEPAGDTCMRYCAAVEQCDPDNWFDECGVDCSVLLADSEQRRVSGLTVGYLDCWATAQTCDAARSCDYEVR